ncbi:MAG: ATP-dependent sacrificial sulfur transferase LarE [Desulfobaccales bacterium]
MAKDLTNKYQRLRAILQDLGSIAVAYSGGVDSTLLLKVAQEVLGERILAITADSETTPRREREDAVLLARELGVEHLVVAGGELELQEFLRNPTDKCYICKKARFSELVKMARERGLNAVVDGGNLDDLADFRPGMRAVEELGVRSPLAEAGLTKAEIRLLSKRLKLPTWSKPTYACLASRIPYHHEITVEKLRQIDAAEELIRRKGLATQVRVRHYGDTARIEVEPESIPRLAAKTVRSDLVKELKALGFKFVTLDLEGYRTGSLNPAGVKTEEES